MGWLTLDFKDSCYEWWSSLIISEPIHGLTNWPTGSKDLLLTIQVVTKETWLALLPPKLMCQSMEKTVLMPDT